MKLKSDVACTMLHRITKRTPQYCGMLYFLLNKVVEHKCPALRAGMKQVTQPKVIAVMQLVNKKLNDYSHTCTSF